MKKIGPSDINKLIIIDDQVEFEWDEWNVEKNRLAHNVMPEEQEQVFLDQDKLIFEDTSHSLPDERRFILIGKTALGRSLYIAYTTRNGKVRIISARDLNKKEANLIE